ncbi:hypothetical protein TREMEDRAFT_64469 [Tremella mesenterica DSM 1558]|uniref:uncharacterized protein n=1 Tax=Tremella mesenterica (strain ATCC 24925 / CBS 8224 / DSM 1558 / NBRC 9311 / NRRL Y-6157 / RJB 2259-6 / UBC 559-6) TaxID=578456 RepID=UPI0003F4A4A5|nr:uncharacterized protein TREMEDRAFT_64469 [Tremella mesenterica DSM 1558]EIW67223.1 hypothetical protein TREMEDRAFT_64469 [Tremella mesenterica DSM 1558]
MSFFQGTPNFLSSKLEVQFDHDGAVDMLGNPNTGTSYSLPGNVLLSLPSLPVGLEGRVREVREMKLLLEGKSEYHDESGRYTPLRLWSTTVDLATPSEPLVLPSQDYARPHLARFQVAIPFDLRLPGWLPPTHSSANTVTSYGVQVQCTIGWVDLSSPLSIPMTRSAALSHSSLSTNSSIEIKPTPAIRTRRLDSLFSHSSLQLSSIHKSQSKFAPITVRRHRLPSAVRGHVYVPGERHYTIKPNESTCPVECVVTVPEWVDVHGDERSIKISLRVRARRDAILQGDASMDIDGGDEILTNLLELGMEVEELERVSSTPATSFMSANPLPSNQPSVHSSEHALLNPSHYANAICFDSTSGTAHKAQKSRQCLLADDGTQRNFFFAKEGLGLCGDKWRKVNVVLPMPADALGKGSATGGRPQAEVEGPFLRIRHSLKIKLVCKNTGADVDTMVLLSTPIRFGTCQDTLPLSASSRSQLPPYIQLFHENGDLRECDPLPLYHPPESTLPISKPRLISDASFLSDPSETSYLSDSPGQSDSPESNEIIESSVGSTPNSTFTSETGITTASSVTTDNSVPLSPAPAYSSLHPKSHSPPSSRSPSPGNFEPLTLPPFSPGLTALGFTITNLSGIPSREDFERVNVGETSLGSRTIRRPESMDIDCPSFVTESEGSDAGGSELRGRRAMEQGSEMEELQSDEWDEELLRNVRRRSAAPPPPTPRTPGGRKIRSRSRVVA